MKRENLTSAARVLSVVFLVSGTCALAQDRWPLQFSGLLNDYSPATVKGGPWEMHGQWSMELHPERGTADFSADMTMSDYGKTEEGAIDPTQAGQSPHTHHIRLREVMVTWDMAGCPTVSPPTTRGFQVSGPVSLLTGNGGPPPFETSPSDSHLQVCVTGGTEVAFSNVSLVFAGAATTHFGSQAIHGVVRKESAEPFWDR